MRVAVAILKVYNGKYLLKRWFRKQPYPGLSHTLIKALTGGGGLGWEFGMSSCKLFHVEWMNHKAPHIAQGTILNVFHKL